jgi:hypothetical protein
MNKSFLITTATIAVALVSAATSAIAIEATQFVPPTGTLTRAEVKAELAQSQARAGAVQLGEATVFVDAPAALQRTQLAAQPQPATRVIQLGEATVFVDQPGTRSRDEVRAEGIAAARSSRGNNAYVGG